MTDFEVALAFQSGIIEEQKAKIEELERRMERDGVASKMRLERSEQYSRRENVRLAGIEEKADEDVEELVIEVARKVGVEIAKGDIQIVIGWDHRSRGSSGR